ncbi:MAG TPA: hypothetical protein VIV57_09360 [Anaeromyxobacter sp.]
MRAPPRIADAARAAILLAGAIAPLALPCSPARAEEPGLPASGGVLHVSAEPPRLLLGRDTTAELRIATPSDVEDVSLSASAGRIEALRRVPGGFAARFRAPSERVPQVAIVAALGRTPHGTEHGWLAIPLFGQGDARVRTSPGQEITLEIGDRSFGPHRAGPDGIAVIPVVVPPGVREAHHGFKPIDLHVPETQLLHAVLERVTVLADRQERVRVVAYVVAPHGAARRGDVPLFEPSRGSVSAVEKEPGAVEAIWILPPGRAGEERLSVRLQASAASRTVLKLETVAGPPAVVAVSFDRDAFVADSAERVTVTARALDAAGNPVPATLSMAAEGAELADVRQRAPGELEARVVAGPSFGGRRQVRVTASAERLGISGARILPLRPGEPAVARFEDAEGILRGDGARASVLRVAVADRHGNPVDAPPAVTAERGKVLEVASAAPGAFDVRYVAPAVSFPTRERLVATVGGAKATAGPLLLAPAPGWQGVPQGGVLADVRGRFVGLRSGFALESPADWALPLEHGFDPSWRAEVEAMGLRPGGAVTLLGGAALARAVDASLVLHASATAGVLAGTSGSSLAARIAAGASLPRRPLTPFLEVALLTARSGAPGPFAALALSVGLRLPLERTHGDDPHRR